MTVLLLQRAIDEPNR